MSSERRDPVDSAPAPDDWSREDAIGHIFQLFEGVAAEMAGNEKALEQDTVAALKALGVTDSEIVCAGYTLA
ncbi:hypothetical protein [Mycobacteroides abscessus]|uniref:hypothetical protein n=1 Tax=Mycobacteroides abscessus TaxID=36809 RepID=UPI00210763A3|nr:hypothetical protein [Mycobacteroides abscessus]